MGLASKIKYPKLIVLLISYCAVFYFFSFLKEIFESFLSVLGYFGIIFSGAMYTYSFTGSIGTASFLILSDTYNSLTLAILGGLGAALADVSILKFLEKFNFEKEILMLSEEKVFRLFKNKYFKSKLFLTFIGLFTIASPLPDELGVILISRGKLLSVKHLFFIGLITNAIGIYIISSV